VECQDGVTIAIPNWNHELVLPRAINSGLRTVSLLRERGKGGEVIVVDDCSRDGSVLLLRQLEARHYRDGLRVLAFGANAGLPASRNAALSAARYRYIAFLDADNELIPDNLPCLVTALENTGAAAAYGNLLIRTATATRAFNAFSSESIQDKIFDRNYIDACAVFDRLQALDLGGYDANTQMWEDLEFWLHLATNGREVLFVPVVFGYYYLLPSGMSIGWDGVKIHAAISWIKRRYNQLDARAKLPLRTRHRRYHPALGYL
jgi:glycosyltransferase involved in cell wall biosynthesis